MDSPEDSDSAGDADDASTDAPALVVGEDALLAVPSPADMAHADSADVDDGESDSPPASPDSRGSSSSHEGIAIAETRYSHGFIPFFIPLARLGSA